MARRRTYWRVAIIVAVLGVMGGVTAGVVQVLVSRPKTLPEAQTGPAPWAPELHHLRERLTSLGLPAAPIMAETIHIHAHLDVFVDGKQVGSDPRVVRLEAHQEIVVAYGTSAQLPRPVPTSYWFPQGL